MNTSIEVTNIQLIAAYGMVDAIASLVPKAVITLGNEIIQEGRKIAYDNKVGYEAMRKAIIAYLTDKVQSVTDASDTPAINVGYMTQNKEITLNLRGKSGTIWFSIAQDGHIGQMQMDDDSKMPQIDYHW